VLVEGEDMQEPVADSARSILDGHCVLTRDLAHRGHYPAIDILQSVSRLAGEITTPEIRTAATRLRDLLAIHHDHADLIAIGAYQAGTDPRVDEAVELMPGIEAFLRQPVQEATTASEADALLQQLIG
jgi:flagellum-specific ATP synthase